MNELNLNRARVIDPVLSTVAQGYRHAQRVGSVLFPAVDVPARGGKVIEFGIESFMDYKARRAPGADTIYIQFGYEGKPFALSQFAINSGLPREFIQDASVVPGIDLGKRAVNTIMDSLTLSLEVEQAALATDAANYGADNKLTLAGSSKWDGPDGDPVDDIDEAKRQVRSTCGIEPNRMVVSASGFKALKNNPKVVERFKYTSAESITAKMLAGLFDLDEVAVGRATYAELVNDQPVFHDIWGDFACLAYTPVQDAAMEQPSYGYTYTLTGNPFVEKPFWHGDRKSWIYGVTYERQPVLTGIASGFLFSSVSGYVAP